MNPLIAVQPPPRPVVLVVMGVSGCGKSTLAQVLAQRLGWAFEEGDALHPQANRDKMAAGQALDDADRAPWLQQVAGWVERQRAAGGCGVITCSALKRAYRDRIRGSGSGVSFVYLHGSREQIAARLAARQGHFTPASLLDSQFATLEEPTADEPAVRVEIGPAPELLAAQIMAALPLSI